MRPNFPSYLRSVQPAGQVGGTMLGPIDPTTGLPISQNPQYGGTMAGPIDPTTGLPYSVNNGQLYQSPVGAINPATGRPYGAIAVSSSTTRYLAIGAGAVLLVGAMYYFSKR